LLLISGSFEFAFKNSLPGVSIFLPGIGLLLFGLTLRLLAILSLGPYWSFNIVLYENHKLIRKGIYRFFRHPAYLGNLYLTGLFVCMNANITSLFSLLFIVSFYLYRTRIENRVIMSLKGTT
jgi:isoprenylcysteine carboxyl methyltransferase (ICMT) family protein YpbQ